MKFPQYIGNYRYGDGIIIIIRTTRCEVWKPTTILVDFKFASLDCPRKHLVYLLNISTKGLFVFGDRLNGKAPEVKSITIVSNTLFRRPLGRQSRPRFWEFHLVWK